MPSDGIVRAINASDSPQTLQDTRMRGTIPLVMEPYAETGRVYELDSGLYGHCTGRHRWLMRESQWESYQEKLAQDAAAQKEERAAAARAAKDEAAANAAQEKADAEAREQAEADAQAEFERRYAVMMAKQEAPAETAPGPEPTKAKSKATK